MEASAPLVRSPVLPGKLLPMFRPYIPEKVEPDRGRCRGVCMREQGQNTEAGPLGPGSFLEFVIKAEARAIYCSGAVNIQASKPHPF